MISESEKELLDRIISIKVHVSQSLNETKQLSSNNWFSDEKISLSQGLLYNWFLLTKDSEGTPLCILKQCFIQKNEFIQIIHDKNHWVTIPIDRETDESMVYLYGSLQKAKVSNSIVKQVCEIRKYNQNISNIVLMLVQWQQNAFDCGVFAVVFATDLVYDKDPDV